MADDKKTQWNSTFLEKDGKKIHYYSHIDGNKPFYFFLHGISDNGLCYDRVAEHFFNRFNVILPDARGHGQSSDPPQKASFKDMVEDIYDICESLHIDKIVIQGHSMGGAQTAYFVAAHPDRVHAAILEDPAILPGKGVKLLMLLVGLFMVLTPHRKEKAPIEKYIKKSKFMNKKWIERDQLIWAYAQQEYALHYAKKNGLMIRNMPIWKTILPQMKVPVLLVTSERGIIRKSVAQRVKDMKSDLQWEYIADAGHNIRREQYEHEIVAIDKYLETISF